MTYTETLDWLFAKLPMYQRQGKTAFKKNLTNILALSVHLHHPEQQFKSIHIAGTNGKGSVAHILASVLQETGYKTGLYTSPHFKDFRERIKVNGRCISEKQVIDFVEKNKVLLEKLALSFFEMTVGMAFAYFKEQKVDIAVIEVGLGGRFDSTNIISPELAIITNIGYDHMQFLGNSLAEIAFEKAGIIKPNTPTVVGETHPETLPVFQKIAGEKDSPLYLAENYIKEIYPIGLKGTYQKKNVRTVLQSIEVLKKGGFSISESAIKSGFLNVIKNTGIQGRWQILSKNPKIIADIAHNKEGLEYTLKQLQEENYERLHIVMGMVDDKNLDKILSLFPRKAIYYFCQANVPRALNKAVLQNKALIYHLSGNSYPSVREAFIQAKKSASASDVIYVGGSTFVVAEVV